MEQGDRCFLWPMLRLEDGTFSVPDAMLQDIWERMVSVGKDKIVFWGGSVQTEEQFINWLKSPFNFPVLVIDREKNEVTFIAWLNNYADKVAMAHFCGIGSFSMEHPRMVMRYWAGMVDANGDPILRTIIGIIPSVNLKALRMVKDLGWKIVGEIPDSCDLYDGSRSGATIVYFATSEWR